MNYPWHETQWQHLTSRFREGRLPHALLFTGAEGLGKLDFARQFTRWLLCNKNKQADAISIVPPCGQCNACALIKAGTHPDQLFISPEVQGKAIAVDTIRQIAGMLSLKSQFGPVQVVVVSPAEAMNKFSANSLLKTLEEPTPDSLLILVSSQPNQLLPTIRSRCQRIEFEIPAPNAARQWLSEAVQQASLSASEQDQQRALQLAGGAPLGALKNLQDAIFEQYDQLLDSFQKLAKKQLDPVTEAEKWAAVGLPRCITWLYTWVSSLIRLKSAPGSVDNSSVWQEPALLDVSATLDSLDPMRLHSFLDHITGLSRIVHSQVNVQLSMEDTLIRWTKLQG